MEHVMNFPRLWESEFIGDWGKYFRDGERVTVRSPNLLFSIIHLAPLTIDLPLTFTLTTSFFTNDYRYTVQ